MTNWVHRKPRAGDVIACRWFDGEKTIGYFNQGDWFRWDDTAMEFNKHSAPESWSRIPEE